METTMTTGSLQQRREELLSEIGATFLAWNDALDAFSQEQFNRVPFQDSWTPAQVAEHILKSVSSLPDARTECTGRPYDEKVQPIADMFLNFSIKMQSPDFVRPGPLPQDKSEVLEVFLRKRARLEKKAGTDDLTQTCLDAEFPTLGLLTRYEWIKFFLFHIQRHTWQLQRILAVMNGK